MTPHLDTADLPDAVLDELQLHEIDVMGIDRWLRANGSDGATGVPDGYLPAAWLHDYCYRTAVVDQTTADRWYRLTLIHAAEGEELVWRILAVARAWWRWAALRVIGRRHYRSDLRHES
jgi:hypothetical protein